MDIKIENIVKYQLVDNAGGNWQDCRDEYFGILNMLVHYKKECVLNHRVHLEYGFRTQYSSPEYFDYGFGGSHLWLKQKGSDDRILIVEF